MIGWLYRWWYGRRLCGAWDPPEGVGRDTHVCLLLRGHKEQHLCKCSARWGRKVK